MILHRYFNSHAFETIRDAKLKTARISSLNDPFEFLYISVGKVTPEDVQNFVRSRDRNPFYAICKSLLEKQFPQHQLTDQDYESFLNKPEAIENIVQQWPRIVKEQDLPFERRRHLIDRELRAICFSDPSQVTSHDEILLWSHYANKHKGIRVEFDFPDRLNDKFEIMGITYQFNRVEVVFSLGSHIAEEEAIKAMNKSAKVKSLAWEYEHEFRLFTKTNACERRIIVDHDGTADVEHFLGFQHEWVRTVDFGALCPDAEIEPVIRFVEANYPKGVVCKKARFHATEYALEYGQI
jgi:Protein of unknown function (DUF2971)